MIHASSKIDSHVDVMNNPILQGNKGHRSGHVDAVAAVADPIP